VPRRALRPQLKRNPLGSHDLLRTIVRAEIRSLTRRSKCIMGVTVFLVVPNFLAFVVISVFLGGDALNGYVCDGHFLFVRSWGLRRG